MVVVLSLALLLVVVIAGFLYIRRPGRERGGFEVPPQSTVKAPHTADGTSQPQWGDGEIPPDDDQLATTGTYPPLEIEPVKFTVHHPQEILTGEWAKLLAYVHFASALEAIAADSEKRLQGQTVPMGTRSDDKPIAIQRGASIRIVPELPGCLCNPPSAEILWLRDWHCQEFEISAVPDQPGYVRDAPVTGRVAFYVESVLVCEVPVWALLATESQLQPRPGLKPTAATDPYDKIFVSYSHDDDEVVDSLAGAYKAIGMDFLRDVDTLRSGELWNPRLLELIDQADIFQLYWSKTASESRYVEQEWRHALQQQRANFIRPVYWHKPMPPPPAELAAINFAYMEPADRH